MDTVRRHPVQPFRDDCQRRSEALRAGIRTDPFRLFDRTASRPGILRVVQARRNHPRGMRHGDRPAGRRNGLCHPRRDRNAHSDDGRHPLGRRDQHPRTGRRTAGLCRRLGIQRSQRRAGLRRGLSAGRRGHHLHDDLHPLCPACEIRKRGRGAGRDSPTDARNSPRKFPWSSPTRCSTDARWDTCAIWSTVSS